MALLYTCEPDDSRIQPERRGKCVCLCGARIESAASTRVMHVYFVTCDIHDLGRDEWKANGRISGRLNGVMYFYFRLHCSHCHSFTAATSALCMCVPMCK